MSEAVTVANCKQVVHHARQCVRIIRDWLPIEGEECIGSPKIACLWHHHACRECCAFFALEMFLVDGPPRLVVAGPPRLGASFLELFYAMRAIRDHYQWQDVDFNLRLPHLQHGAEPPPIEPAMLIGVERAIAGIERWKAADNTTRKTTPPKKRKKRPMNARAADCARIYRNQNGQDTMKSIVEDYVARHGGSTDAIMRTLNDNPDQWKSDT